MKILVFHLGLRGKRAWGRIYPISKALSEFDNNVTLITSSHSYRIEYIKEQNLKIIAFPGFLPNNILNKGFGFLNVIIRSIYAMFNKFDLVITDNSLKPTSGIPAFIQKIIYKTIYISEWWDIYGLGGHFDNKPKLIKEIYGRLFTRIEILTRKKASAVTVLSENMYQRAINNGIPASNIEIVPGGSLINVLKPQNSNTRYIKNNKDILNFGFIGMGDGEVEDMEPFFYALSNLKDKAIKFHYFGNEFSKFSINKFKIENIIIQHGWVDYYKDISKLHNVDVFVLIKKNSAINNHGWPNKLGDYLSLGKPVLVTPYSSISSFIDQYPNGFIKTKWDTSSIITTINSIYNNEYCLDEMGKQNRQIAEKECAWEERAKRILTLYKNIKL